MINLCDINFIMHARACDVIFSDHYILGRLNPAFPHSVPGLLSLVCAYLPHMSPDFLGWVASHSLSLHGTLFWNWFLQWDSCTRVRYPLAHSPTIQRSTIEVALKEFPAKLMLSSAWQTQDGTSAVLFTLYSSRKMHRQNMAWRQIHRLIHASQMLDRLVSPCELKFQYLHGSQFWVVLVSHLSEADWSGLPWGVLPTVLGVTFPYDPASAGALSTGGAGVGEVVFPSLAMGCLFHPALC